MILYCFESTSFCDHVLVLYTLQALAKDIKEMTEKMDKNKNLFSHMFPENADNRGVIEETLNCLQKRLVLLETLVNQRCEQMKERLQHILSFQVEFHQMFMTSLILTIEFVAVSCMTGCQWFG